MTTITSRRQILTALGCGLTAFAQTPPIAIGSRRELFIDRYLVDSITGSAELRQAAPVPAEVALKLDRPYEGPFSAYFTVLQCHDRKYRVYYRGVPDAGQDGRMNEVTCYAESEDGIRFQKPADNIILRAQPPFSHNFCPFVDTNAKSLAGGRYKALSGTAKSGLRAWTSDDGVRWRVLREQPVMPPTTLPMFDSQNLAFWSEHEGCYVAYVRQFRNKIRSIVRATSPDFLQWTPFLPLDIEGEPEHLYTNQLHPYFRAPHIYAAMAARFMPGRQVLSDEEAQRAGVVAGYYKDTSDSVLLTSRGGDAIQRTFRNAFLRPGFGLNHWSSRGNYPGLNVVPTGTGGDEMSFYVNRHYGQPTAHLQRFTLRTDGFSSLYAGYRGGQLITKPIQFKGQALELNYSTSAAGSVRVGILSDKSDRTRAVEDCVELIGDRLDRTVSWRSGPAVGELQGHPIRLIFALRDADIYSFRFRS